jgi:hypothetical protein
MLAAVTVRSGVLAATTVGSGMLAAVTVRSGVLAAAMVGSGVLTAVKVGLRAPVGATTVLRSWPGEEMFMGRVWYLLTLEPGRGVGLVIAATAPPPVPIMPTIATQLTIEANKHANGVPTM